MVSHDSISDRRLAQPAIALPGGCDEIAEIDGEIDAGDAGGEVGGEKAYSGGNFSRLEKPARRARTRHGIGVENRPVDAFGERRGPGEPGRYRIDPHTGAAPFRRKALRKIDDTRLRRTIGMERA